jgi:dGTPase
MAPYGGFEGNAQTLRILTRTIYGEAGGRGGMSPSRALIDGVLKYKRLYRDRAGESNHFIYDDQAPLLEFCFQTGDLPAALGGVPVNDFKSLECQIMDLADDLAYSSFDIVDGVKARFLTPARLREWAAGRELDSLQAANLEQLIEMIEKGRVEPGINRLIGRLIESIDLRPVENFMSGRTRRYGWQIVRPEETSARFQLHRLLCRDLIFGASALQQIEFKGRRLLRQLAETLLENYLEAPRPATLLPEEVHRAVRAAGEPAARARLLCDHLSGMTDAYALRSYKRLFDPGFGSISDLI